MHEKALFIINKASGTRNPPDLEAAIHKHAKDVYRTCDMVYTKRPGHATVLAHEVALLGNTAVYAVGGDGTVNEVAQGLIGSSCPLGIIPKGSGNGLARHLGISTNIGQALASLKSHVPIYIDTFLVNGRLSVNISGIGFDAHVAHLFAHKTQKGLMGYTKIVFGEYLHYKEHTIYYQTETQKKKYCKSIMINFANSSQFGNNVVIAPGASLRDGLLDLCFTRKIPLLQIPNFACQLFLKKVTKSNYITTQKASSIQVHSDTPLLWHVDGEPCTKPAFQFTITTQPHSLQVLIPKNFIHTV